MIPMEEFWPEGFTTDYVTGFPDQPMLFVGTWWKPWTWLDWVHADLREEAWYHDLRYFLGWPVGRDYPLIALAAAKPLTNADRSEKLRELIDEMLEDDLVKGGVHPLSAKIAARGVVKLLGGVHYWWADPKELLRRALT